MRGIGSCATCKDLGDFSTVIRSLVTFYLNPCGLLDCMMSPISKQYEIEIRRREVRDLRIHCACERQKFSRTVLDLINYCQQNILSDPLIHRVKDNPFNEKKWTCGMF
uniref:G protein gamma domain-containing protein n=1 Tax=Schistosoma mansoni TaxID=6183 RepID=A0A146MII8_SCHMA